MEDFRLNMIESKMETLEKDRTYSKSYGKTDQGIGEHFPLEVIVRKEGG